MISLRQARIARDLAKAGLGATRFFSCATTWCTVRKRPGPLRRPQAQQRSPYRYPFPEQGPLAENLGSLLFPVSRRQTAQRTPPFGLHLAFWLNSAPVVAQSSQKTGKTPWENSTSQLAAQPLPCCRPVRHRTGIGPQWGPCLAALGQHFWTATFCLVPQAARRPVRSATTRASATDLTKAPGSPRQYHIDDLLRFPAAAGRSVFGRADGRAARTNGARAPFHFSDIRRNASAARYQGT